MRILDVLAYALSDYWDNKFKTFLSCLGIIIGVMAIITLLTVSAGVVADLTQQFSHIETDTILVSPKVYTGMGAYLTGSSNLSRATLPPAQFTDRDVGAIRNVTGVAAIYPEICTAEEVVYKNDTAYVQQVTAVIPGMSRYSNMVVSGRFLQPSDTNAIVIGSNIANGTFPGEVKVGSNITIFNQNKDTSKEYQVVGVLRQIDTSSVTGDPNSVIYMTRAGFKYISGHRNYTSIVVKASSVTNVEATAGGIENVLAPKHPNEAYSVMTSEALTKTVTRIFDMITLVMAAISAISLVVGGIGILNVMLLTVKERVKEIGLMKAVGATRRDIRLIFVTESVMLGIFSGVTGVAFAAVLSVIIGRLAGIPMVITLHNVAIGIAFGILTTTIAGVYPANQAAKLDPIDALRTE